MLYYVTYNSNAFINNIQNQSIIYGLIKSCGHLLAWWGVPYLIPLDLKLEGVGFLILRFMSRISSFFQRPCPQEGTPWLARLNSVDSLVLKKKTILDINLEPNGTDCIYTKYRRTGNSVGI